MRIGELSRRSRVGVPLIKYYLREGMLPAGERAGAPNQATYGEEHLRRLRLLRALVEQGGLSASAIKDVLAALDGGSPLGAALGTTQNALTPRPDLPDDPATASAEQAVAELVARRGWRVDRNNPGWAVAVGIVATYHRLGYGDLAALLEPYGAAMESIATPEVETVVAHDDRDTAVEVMVTGTVLGAGLLTALRAMAQQDAAIRLLDRPWPPAAG